MPHKDPEKRAAYQRQWYEKNRAKLLIKAKTYREANPEEVAATKKRCYERNMESSEWRAELSAKQKATRKSDPERIKGYERTSRERRKEVLAEYQREIANTPQTKARQKVNAAVRRGALPRASSIACADCNEPAREYHHESYDENRWLDVVALCSYCHKARHAT